MTDQEMTQYLNLAKSLDLLASSYRVGGICYVYDATGYKRPLESFMSDFPLERLQAMISRMQARL